MLKRILLIPLILFLFQGLSYSQCKWVNIDTLDFENSAVDTGIVATSVYHTTPMTFGVRTGSKGLYFNVQNSPVVVPAGSLLYHRTFPVCTNVPYQFSFYYKTLPSSVLCDITIKLYDGATLINTIATGPISTTIWQQYVQNFTPTSGVLKLELYTNIPGSGGGNDLQVDDMVLKNCHKYYTDNLFICSGNSNYNIFDTIPATTITNTTGSWTGPSSLTNSYLGTFNPSTNTNGNYTYTFVSPSVRCISDSAVITINTAVCGNSCPVLILNNDTTLCKNALLQLKAKLDTGAISSIVWSPSWGLSNAAIWNPTTTATKDTTYYVTAQAVSPINLIANGDFSLGNASFTSGYTYCSAAVPPIGCVQTWGLLSCQAFYTITTSPNLAHNNFSTFNNHTGGVGNMLVVNGASNPSISVWCQTVTVTPNTNYNLSAWVANVDPFSSAASLGILSFNINGIQQGPTFSPVLATGVWTNSAIVWNSGANTLATICINNNSVATGGNDFAIDDISFNKVCSVTDSVKITVNIPPTIALPKDSFLCGNVNININPTITGRPTPTLLWQNSSAANTYHATTLGTYWCQASNGCGTKRDTMKISSAQAPVSVDLGLSRTICNLDSIHINPTAVAATPVTYKWQDSTIRNYFNATTNGKYFVRAYNNCGSVWDTVSLIFKKKPTIDAGLNRIVCNQNAYLINPTVTGSSIISYKWQDSSTLSSFIANASKLYFVRAYNECGSAWDTTRITFKTSPTVDLGSRVKLCDSNSYKFIPVVTGSALLNYRWQDSSSLNNFTATSTGVYFVRVFNECGSVWDTTSLQLRYKPVVTLPKDTDLCDKPKFTLLPTVTGTPNLVYMWNTGLMTDSIMVNKTGNYKVNVTNVCGSDADTIYVNFLKSPKVTFTNPIIKQCYKSPLQITPVVTGSKPYQYIWNDASTDTTISINKSDTLFVNVTNKCGSSVDTVKINLIPYPQRYYFGEEFTICDDTFVNINSHNYNSSHWWNPLFVNDSIVRLNKTGLYTVTLINQAMCAVIDSVRIKTKDCAHGIVLMPNAFTPNGDGIDDFVYPIVVGENAHITSFLIYNRWGQLVYSPNTKSDTEGWNGNFVNTPQPVGTYIYIIEYNDFDKAKILKGDILLLR